MSVKEFKAALKDVWKNGEMASWPYRNVILTKDVLQQYYSDYNMAIKEAYNCECMPNVGPTGILRSFDILVKAMKYSTKEENRALVSGVLSLLSKLKKSDILNSTGRNMIYGSENVISSYQTSKYVSPDIVHRIIALLKSYAELMYFRSYEISQEIHGPYTLDYSKLIVWHYRNLRPDILSDMDCLLPCDSVIIELFYTNSVDIKLDLYNHVYQKGENFRDNLKAGSIVIDQKPATSNDLIELELLLISRIQKLYRRYKQLKDTEYIQAYINTLWYKLSLISHSVNLYQICDSDLAAISISKDINAIDQRIINLLF
ncbi:MAG: hypothetical protein N3I35_16580 [Clostridia bacterium]|nr:hypothetical protein [Clostridia bacterium]